MSLFIEEELDGSSTLEEILSLKYYPGWTEKFQDYKSEIKDFTQIMEKKLSKAETMYPKKLEIFSQLENTPLDKVKVVIWTDNPRVIPSSITTINKEMYKELSGKLGGIEQQYHFSPLFLRKQGVLFMSTNMCDCGKLNKETEKIWLNFTNIVIDILNQNVKSCIHLIWGKNSESIMDQISSREVYTTSSPTKAFFGFNGCNHFIKTNITLKRKGKEEIMWKEPSEQCLQ